MLKQYKLLVVQNKNEMSHTASEGEGDFLLTVTSDKVLEEDGRGGCPAGEATEYWQREGRDGGRGGPSGPTAAASQAPAKPRRRPQAQGSQTRIGMAVGRQGGGAAHSISEARRCSSFVHSHKLLPLKSSSHFLCILSLSKP